MNSPNLPVSENSTNNPSPLNCFDSTMLCFVALLGILQIRGDGYFPLPRSWPEDLLMQIVLLHTMGVVAVIILACRRLIFSQPSRQWTLSNQTTLVACGVVPVLAITAICGIHVWQGNRFADFGYQPDSQRITIYFLCSLIPLIGFWLVTLKKRSFSVLWFLSAILASSFILKMVPLELFPLTAKRSDMLPFLKQACGSVLRGEHPYQYYMLDNGIMTPNVRFPGIIFGFLPAVALGVDLRFASVTIEVLLFGWIAYAFFINKPIPEERSKFLSVMVGIFILFPYWHLRHELYEAPFLLVLLATFLALSAKRITLFSICVGLLISTHQWGVLFAPFLVIYLIHEHGWKTAFRCGIIAVIVAGIIFSAVIQFHYQEFYANVVELYVNIVKKQHFFPLSLSFTAYLGKYGLAGWLFPTQAFLQCILIFVCYRFVRGVEGLAGILALSLTAILLFNGVCWTYQYLSVVFLILLGMLFSRLRYEKEALDNTNPKS